MHLWPSMRIRDSFKKAYLDKMDLNLHKMKNSSKKIQSQSQSPSSSSEQKLLPDKNNEEGDADSSKIHCGADAILCFRGLIMMFTCCYCCFCCGVCVDEDD